MYDPDFIEYLMSGFIELDETKPWCACVNGEDPYKAGVSMFEVIVDNNYANTGDITGGGVPRFEDKINYKGYTYDLFVAARSTLEAGFQEGSWDVAYQTFKADINGTHGANTAGMKPRGGFTVIGYNSLGTRTLVHLVSIDQQALNTLLKTYNGELKKFYSRK